MPPERHTTFYELWDALATGDDCPICLLHRQRARTFMESFFYENVNDPGMRQHLHDALGFGPEASALAEDLHDALGLSITYAALAFDVVQRLESSRARLEPAEPCPLTTVMRETEARYLHEFARHYAEHDLQDRHAAGFGFCLGHLAAVLQLIDDQPLRAKLRAVERGNFARLHGELQRFVEKSSYDNRVPLGPEADAWQRALRKFRHTERR